MARILSLLRLRLVQAFGAEGWSLVLQGSVAAAVLSNLLSELLAFDCLLLLDEPLQDLVVLRRSLVLRMATALGT